MPVFFFGKVHEIVHIFVVLRFCVVTIYRPDPKQIIHKFHRFHREQSTTGKYLRVCVEVHSALILQIDLQFY